MGKAEGGGRVEESFTCIIYMYVQVSHLLQSHFSS